MPDPTEPEKPSLPVDPVSHLHVENVRDKWRYVKAAKKAGLTLSEWIILTLNQAATAAGIEDKAGPGPNPPAV